MNNQKKLIVMVITLSLILIISSSYALLRSTKVSVNNYSISIGNLEVTFKDNQTEKLNLTNMYPMSDDEGEGQEKALTFTVENTGTVGTYYDIYIEELSTNPEFKSVIRFISKKDEEEYTEPKTLSENKYIEITGYIEPQQTSTYKVKVWLAEEADNTYMKKKFKAKIIVKAFQNYATEVIKAKLVEYEESSKEDFQGGLVAVNTNSELYNETDENQTIREYRYSGPNVNNYVTFNDETWRILGVFKDENGEDHVKIVRNEILKYEDFPATYEANGKTYKIQYIDGGDYAYWNMDINDYYSNDWTTSGLMNWLNSKGDKDGYLKTLTSAAQNMIIDTTYYLGNVYYDDTTVQSYEDERKTTKCSSDDSNSHERNCYIWSRNQATWIGKIGLMYPSDYGFSTDSSNWSVKKLSTDYISFRDSSWLYKNANLTNTEWLLSPDSYNAVRASNWQLVGNIFDNWCSLFDGVRPTLYLKSNVKITGGTGEQLNPYILSEN